MILGICFKMTWVRDGTENKIVLKLITGEIGRQAQEESLY